MLSPSDASALTRLSPKRLGYLGRLRWAGMPERRLGPNRLGSLKLIAESCERQMIQPGDRARRSRRVTPCPSTRRSAYCADL